MPPATASLRGPIFGRFTPAHAAEMPSVRITRLKAHAVSV
jgi:hypothetical protein